MIRWIILLLGIVAFTACERSRTPERHLIPADYEGVVIVIYGQEGFPELPMKEGYRVFEYPQDGILITSSEPGFGWASDDIVDVLPDGSFRRISSGEASDRREHFAAFGSQEAVGEPTIDYGFKVIGSMDYWSGIDSVEYDRKKEDAIRKLRSLRTQNSEQGTGGNAS